MIVWSQNNIDTLYSNEAITEKKLEEVGKRDLMLFETKLKSIGAYDLDVVDSMDNFDSLDIETLFDFAVRKEAQSVARYSDYAKASSGEFIDDTIVADATDVKGVDQKLVVYAKACNGRIGTTDYNLTKVAQVREVDVVNINDIANSLKTIVIPGEQLQIKIIKAGEELSQGVGYLDDGTMVVVEDARDKIGKEMYVDVTSSLQTSAGKMIFGKFDTYASGTSGTRSNGGGYEKYANNKKPSNGGFNNRR